MTVKKKLQKSKPKKRKEHNSPVEEMFYEMSQKIRLPLVRQHSVGFYFLDFAYLDNLGYGFKIAIEIDGQKFHSSYAQRQKDYERERFLLSQGFVVVRFTGSEIYNNCEKCIFELIDLIHLYNRKLRILNE